ncbi:MAG: beta-lactamase family protein [candidate division Zixibacteria bacterium]|nr:beta-lactamase family protein [candidate division Zixibacteria bacterium]
MKQRHILLVAAIIFTANALINCGGASSSKIIPVISPDEQIPELSSDKELVAFFEEFIQEIADENNFNGVVLFARDDKIFFHRAYGIANRASGERITPDTKFNLASASKMFTAVGIAKLVEEGRLNFNDPIAKYLDSGWVSKAVGEKVLISHLLSHTSGMGSYWGEKWDKYKDSISVLDDFKKVTSDELSFEPGTDDQYSNTGYILLGAIIESITDQSYYEYVNDLIFKPLQMENTGFIRQNEPYAGRAVGYFEDKEDKGIFKDNLALHGARGGPAGGCWSTASDMHRFMRGFAADALISPASRKYLTTPNGLFEDYGYGFQLGTGWCGHWGGFPGIEAFVMYYPKTGHTLVAFSNYYDSALPLLDKLEYIYKKISGE